MIKSIVSLIIISLFLISCGATKQKTAVEKYKGLMAEQIYDRGEKSMAAGGYESAITDFEAIETLYPFSPSARQARLNLIYANFEAHQYPEAEAAAARYIYLYPRGTDVDYAYYMKGLANFNQDRGVFQRYIKTDLSKRDMGTVEQSFADFNELVTRFPTSPYAQDAQKRMIFLRNLMAKQQLNIALYYFRIKAYVAAINRANDILIHYQESPQVIPALGVIAESYHRLGLSELAEQTKEILALNFPESAVYVKVVKVLKNPVTINPPPVYLR